MAPKTKKLIIILASVLIVLAIIGIVVSLVLLNKSGTSDIGTETTYLHEAEESFEAEGSNTKTIKYYDKDIYTGKKDVYTDPDDGTIYTMIYDADDNEIESEKEEFNSQGKPTYYSHKSNGELDKEITYEYSNDLTTLKKVLTKTYDSEGEHALKQLYDDDGVTIIKEESFLNEELIEN